MVKPVRSFTFLQHIRPRRIPVAALRFGATLCLGGLSFLAFLITVGTGILLLFHYEPGKQAYISVASMVSLAPYGAIIRSLHFWAAQGMVVTVLFHMARVVWHHAYRPPREKNWVIGVFLFLLTLILDFSGYLLRGDREGAGAAEIAQSLLRGLPGGAGLAALFLGSMELGHGSSLPLYVWHVFILPGVLLVLQLWHFWRVRRDGGVRAL
ncbi:MAG: cytochrome b N-terminal domain-containing protein [Desulfitobacteriaceae bacterium]|nr:cytochrome b N-terminal domain-containing protein [Desulfitobacteriaceae bacterium]MDI6879248.1 cytochrome b N-terminal domain-containing protein [Desulfitobacteriaceae bacterium]MDI6913728.1 cytochrome b N-terminal domain-containing protein [Desulfitobacteriaceae bacterium]